MSKATLRDIQARTVQSEQGKKESTVLNLLVAAQHLLSALSGKQVSPEDVLEIIGNLENQEKFENKVGQEMATIIDSELKINQGHLEIIDLEPSNGFYKD
jgi:hypothetical protein